MITPRLRRVEFWGSWLILACLLCAVAPMMAQDLDWRVRQLEEVKGGTRLATIEVRLDNIEFLGKTILAAIIGQLVLSGMSLRARASEKRDNRVSIE